MTRTNSKANIAAAARNVFSEQGYAKGTLRTIAQRANVDPGLIIHYFGSKEQLFVEVMTPSLDTTPALPEALSGDPALRGAKLARFFLETLENPQNREIMIGLLRAAMTEPKAAELLKQTTATLIMKRFGIIGGAAGTGLNINLLDAQLMGLMMTRYIAKIEPVASASTDAIISYLAPVLQTYLDSQEPASES